MRATQMKIVLVALAMAGVALVLFLQQQRLTMLRAEHAALRRQIGGMTASRTAPVGVAEPAVAEPALVQQQRTELLRLRGEVTRLRSEARQSKTGAAASAPGAGATLASTPEAEAAPFKATATANVASGESFATGGWLTSPGFRTFLLTTPTLGKGSPDEAGINIAMCLLKVPEGAMPEALLRKLNDPSQPESPLLTGTEVAFLSNLLTAGDTNNIISRPRIATSDGEPASLFIGETRPNPDGTQRQIGTLINISPEIAQDRQTIRMAVNLEYTPREDQGEEEAAKPN